MELELELELDSDSAWETELESIRDTSLDSAPRYARPPRSRVQPKDD